MTGGDKGPDKAWNPKNIVPNDVPGPVDCAAKTPFNIAGIYGNLNTVCMYLSLRVVTASMSSLASRIRVVLQIRLYPCLSTGTKML